MAPSKKKKTAIKKPARPVASTSLPSKKVEEAPKEVVESAGTTQDLQSDVNGTTDQASPDVRDGKVEKVAEVQEFDEREVEEQYIRNLTEKMRPIVDKEVSKTVKVYEYERRLSKTLPQFIWLDDKLEARALEAALGQEKAEIVASSTSEKEIIKATVIYRTLLELNFPLEKVGECMRKVRVLELEECFDWLFLHCSEDELLGADNPKHPQYGPDITSSSLSPNAGVPLTPSPNKTFSSMSVPRTPGGQSLAFKTPMTPTSPVVIPPTPTIPSASSFGQKGSDRTMSNGTALDNDLKSRILASALQGDDDEANELEDDPNARYVQTKFKIEALKALGRKSGKKKKDKDASTVVDTGDTDREIKIKELEERLKALEGEYFFNRSEADHLFKLEKQKRHSAPETSISEDTSPNLSADRSGDISPFRTPSKMKQGDFGQQTLKTTNGNGQDLSLEADSPAVLTPKSGSDAGDSDSEGGLFGNLLEEMPTELVDPSTGTTIVVKDMQMPKHFSGKTPKALIIETIRRMDRVAVANFKPSTGSRVVSASLSIIWDNGKMNEFEMGDVACYDEAQAFNYVATIALFHLSPNSTIHRQLPPVFRDLWAEIEVAAKKEDLNVYCESVKLCKEIVDARAEFGNSESKGMKAEMPTDGTSFQTSSLPVRADPAQIQQDMANRQTWASYQDMLVQRLTLPIAQYRNIITDAIEQNQAIVLCGETGCGKSTQVPSFILESDMYLGKHVKIFCTEPRRISAISLAQRVSKELGDPPNACGTRSSLVGYSIRLEAKVTSNTRLVYATNGIVLRMLESEASMEDVTHIIIDEVHERSIESDFLLIILKQLMSVRPDLKVILMSATLEAEKISAYMGGCPVINVPGRTFPVTSHFLEDVIEVCNYRLTPNSDSPYIARNYRRKNSSAQWEEDEVVNEEEERKDEKGLSLSNTYSAATKVTLSVMDHYVINYELIMLLLETICIVNPYFVANYSKAILIFMPSLESIRRLMEMLESHKLFGSKAFVLFPLHSTISNDNQGLVFEVPKSGTRKIVVSTNIAETGITIPDIQCVIDTGKHREMRFDEKRQISHLVETFIAKSNVAQRRGRAGRVQEGIAFHLFSKERYEDILDEHPQPEMLRLSLQDLALRIKILKIGVGGIEDTLSKALDPPAPLNVQRAIASLVEVKALTATEEITPLGRHLVKLPLDVHLAKFLIFSCLFQCLDASLTIAAVLNSKSPFVTPFGRETEADTVKRSFKIENSDFLAYYKAYVMWRQSCQNNTFREFCRKHFLSHQNLLQIEELRGQYFNYLCDAGFVSISDSERRMMTSLRYGRARCRFTKVPADLDIYSADPKAVMTCLAASMYPKLIMIDPATGALRTISNNAPVQIHPSSVNFEKGKRVDFGQGVRFVTFFTIMRSTKLYVWESGTVDEKAVYLLCGDADIKLPAYSLTLDRKIRTRLSPSTAISFKFMRKGFQQAFQTKMLKPSQPLPENLQTWFDIVKLSVVGELEGTKEEDQAQTKVTVSIAKQAF